MRPNQLSRLKYDAKLIVNIRKLPWAKLFICHFAIVNNLTKQHEVKIVLKNKQLQYTIILAQKYCSRIWSILFTLTFVKLLQNVISIEYDVIN